jgi:L-iditol 2-dehydrogenase
MKAVATDQNGVISIVDIPLPTYGDYECLVKVKACGICNSTDLKIIKNAIGDLPIKYPALLGHESVGEIVAVGSKVRHLKVGDRVVNPKGRLMPGTPYFSFWTAMSEYGIAHDVRAMLADGIPMPPGVEIEIPEDYPVAPIPEGMSYEDAAILLTIKENYSALKNFDMQAGKDVFIYGDGPIALGLAVLARAMGAGFIGIAGHHDKRLKIIQDETKIDLAVNTHDKSVLEVVGKRSFDIVIDAVGSVAIVREASKMLKAGGRICVYGVLKKTEAEFNLLDLPNNTCLQVLNRPHHEYRSHDEVCALVKAGAIRVKAFYSHVLPIDEAAKGFELVKSREAYKVVLSL